MISEKSQPVGSFSRASGRLYYGWFIVVASALVLLTSFGIEYSFGIFFKALQFEFSWNRALTSSLFSFHLLATGFFSILGGHCLDRYGPRRMFSVMGFITGLSLILVSRASAPWQLYLSYSLLLPMGTGAIYILVMGATSRWFLRKRASALGIIGAGGGLGSVIMSPVIAWMIASYDWRTAYLLLGALAWLVMIPLALVFKKDPSEVGQSVDGGVITKGPAGSDWDKEKGKALSQAVKTKQFWQYFLIWFSYSYCLHIVMGHLVPRAEDSGIDPVRAATVLSLLTAATIPSRVVAGFMADRFNKNRIYVVCALVHLLAMIWLTRADELWMFYVFALGYGLAYGSIDPPIIAMVGESFGLDQLGSILGVLMVAWGLGSAAGPFVSGLIFDLSGEYTLAFLSGGIFFALSAVWVLIREILKGSSPKD